jgi:peroxiredoxin
MTMQRQNRRKYFLGLAFGLGIPFAVCGSVFAADQPKTGTPPKTPGRVVSPNAGKEATTNPARLGRMGEDVTPPRNPPRTQETARATERNAAPRGNANNAAAAGPSVDEALSVLPRQSDVDIDKPTDAKQCKLEALPTGDGVILRDSTGQILRKFIDTNHDDRVDQWSFYKDGLEAYRDIDSDFDGRADQSRWFNTAGCRWGVDRDQDGVIDQWKSISAEEVSAELVAAIATRNAKRFEKLLLTENELNKLGLGGEKTKELAERLSAAGDNFRKYLAKQQVVTADTHWVYFGGSRPGVVPAGTNNSTADVTVYENVAAMLDTKGKPGQIAVGALVKVGETWRLVDAPAIDPEKVAAGHVFFPQPDLPQGSETPTANAAGEPSEAERDVLSQIDKLDQQISETSTESQAPLYAKHSDLLERLCKETENEANRTQWTRQLIDSLGAAVQTSGYPAGLNRLERLTGELARQSDADLAGHARYTLLMAKYTQSLGGQDVDFPKIQQAWIETLQDFVKEFPSCQDTADALLQLATTYELSGKDEQAIATYKKLANLPKSTQQQKALGAIRRVESVGNSIPFRAKDITGRPVDLASSEYKNKVVVIHYFRSDYDTCKQEVATLKDLYEEYGKDGLRIIGVSLDDKPETLAAFTRAKRIDWSQIYEPGGMDNRLANDMGIINLPTMLLVGRDGTVLNNRMSAMELGPKLKELLRKSSESTARKRSSQVE